jgi:methionine transaminase
MFAKSIIMFRMISTTNSLSNRTIATMSKMAKDFSAIDLTHSVPDFGTSEVLLDILAQNLRLSPSTYTNMYGYLPLREKIAELYQNNHNSTYSPESEVTITNGINQTMLTAISTFIKENDEVIIFEPAMDSYAPFIKYFNGVPVYIQMKQPDFVIDWDDVIKAITARTKLIIISNPHNPSGSVLSEGDLEMLSKLLTGSKITVIFEEIFENIVFDGHQHLSAARFPKLWERSFIMSTFTRSLILNNWNIAHCVAPDKLMREFRKIYQHIAITVNYPLQVAIHQFIQNEEELQKASAYYQQKRDLLINLFQGSKYKLKPCASTYYQLIDFSKVSDEKDKSFATRLVSDFKVAAVPLSSYYHDNIDSSLLRLCFSKPDEMLKQAVEQILRIE